MISHQHKFIFVHINCCAGSSIEAALHNFGEWRPQAPPGTFQYTQHFQALEYINYYPETKNYYKFAIVRNPWARMVAYYATHSNFHHGFKDTKWLFRRWVKKLGNVDESKSFHDFERMYSSSHSWVYQNNECLVDYVGKFEDVSNEFQKICTSINIKADLPYRNVSLKRHDYREYYDDKTAEIIAQRFAKDISSFGYTFES
jgi:hypothetical protein